MKHKYTFAALAALALAALLPTEAEYYWLAVGIPVGANGNVNNGAGNYLVLTNDDPSVSYDAVKLYDVRRRATNGTELYKNNGQNSTAPYEGCPHGGAHYDLRLPIRDEAGNEFTLVKLDSRAFEDNSYVGSVKFSATLEEIGDYAFRRAAYLKSAEFPADTSAIVRLGAQIFDSCSRLEGYFVWPSQCTTLGNYTFINTKIQGFYGPSVTTVGNNAFNSCTSLKAIEFGASVEFGTEVFRNTRAVAFRVLFHDAPPVIDSNNNLIGNSNAILDWWGNGNANATLYVPLNAAKDGPTENWLAFKTEFEAAVEGNLITWPTQNADGTWTDGSIYTKKPNKTSTLRFWDPASTTSALLAH